MSFDGTYRTIATLAGRETFTHDSQQVEVLLVDVEWHHQETGDVYPPGPDASGGRYWLVTRRKTATIGPSAHAIRQGRGPGDG